jgi:hypothetical protein
MKLIILALSALSVFGQSLTVPRYIAYKATTSTTSEKVTVQQVTGGQSKTVHFDRVVVQCTTACVVTLSQNGTAATATALTITPINLSTNTRSVAFSGSDVGTGTVLSTYNNPAAGLLTLDVSQLYLSRNASSANNFTVGVTCASGDVKIQINWTEE